MGAGGRGGGGGAGGLDQRAILRLLNRNGRGGFGGGGGQAQLVEAGEYTVHGIVNGETLTRQLRVEKQ